MHHIIQYIVDIFIEDIFIECLLMFLVIFFYYVLDNFEICDVAWLIFVNFDHINPVPYPFCYFINKCSYICIM